MVQILGVLKGNVTDPINQIIKYQQISDDSHVFGIDRSIN